MATGKIKKVLIANRGEVALRIIRTVRELGLTAVAIYEKPDSEAYFIRSADDAIMIGDGPRKDYLDINKVVSFKRLGKNHSRHNNTIEE